MRIFRKIQAYVAIITLWTVTAVSSSYEVTDREILANAVLVMLVGMVVINVLTERAKEEIK